MLKIINYIRRFGIKATFVKTYSSLFFIFFSNFILSEDKSKGLDTFKDEESKNLKSLDTDLMPADYAKYVKGQIDTSLRRSIYINPARKLIHTRDKLIQHLVHYSKDWQIKTDEVLSIGCRDDRELDGINLLLPNSSITGLDLFSASDRIIAGDMHAMPFDNERFDISVSIHSMEHSYDPNKSLKEIHRVTKVGGLICIEVPIRYSVTEIDRQNFESIEKLISFFPENSIDIIFSELESRLKVGKSPTLRCILRRV
ncbi:class I SAM-dependent methyltransferase [Prochlorococcus sp. MIT 1011]|uniref:class I SAM-dependent methyltransferase n=1 Tax=Prochlorococcus sp. MIT 1011 TaxID=3082520 RepID=UPI0039B69EEF